jgi:hypothetical protein
MVPPFEATKQPRYEIIGKQLDAIPAIIDDTTNSPPAYRGKGVFSRLLVLVPKPRGYFFEEAKPRCSPARRALTL